MSSMYDAYTPRINMNIASQSDLQSGQYDPNYMISKSDGLTYINNGKSSTDGLNYFFNQETPYKFPPLVICDDTKRINQNEDIYQKYSDVIYDECGNRFNIRNLKDSAGLLQAGYSNNIDLDSHMKNINFYNDKCFYDNWKMNPKSKMDPCNGLKRNSVVLAPDYTPVGKNYDECIGNPSEGSKGSCSNTPPTDLGFETDVRKRYDFSHNNFKTESCIKPADRVSFKTAPVPDTDNMYKYPNEKRNMELLKTINKGVEHEYYKFFEDTKYISFPQQRLFNNITKAKCLPSHHFMGNIEPKYLSFTKT